MPNGGGAAQLRLGGDRQPVAQRLQGRPDGLDDQLMLVPVLGRAGQRRAVGGVNLGVGGPGCRTGERPARDAVPGAGHQQLRAGTHQRDAGVGVAGAGQVGEVAVCGRVGGDQAAQDDPGVQGASATSRSARDSTTLVIRLSGAVS